MSIYDKASLVLIPSGTKTSKVYSQKPVSGDGDFTFSRSTAATRVNADGNIEKETQNLLTYSNTFNVSWSNNGDSITGGQSGYDGSNDAWLFTTTASSQYIAKGQGVSGVQTFSVYAKAGTADAIVLRIIGGSNPYVYWNLNDGSYAGSGGGASIIARDSTSIGNGWYRVTLSIADTSSSVRIYCGTSSGDFAAGNIYIQDAQLEQGLVARDYIETTTTAVEGGITDNVPRLDYTDSSCPALLLEPQRMNVVYQSEYLGGWAAANCSVTANSITSPEGVTNSFKITENSAASTQHRVSLSSIGGSSAIYTMSAYVKNSSGSRLAYIDMGPVTGHFNFATETMYSAQGTANWEDAGDGWYRISITSNSAISPVTAFAGLSVNNNETYSGDGSSAIEFYGIQLEAGSYATSYIPTYGSAVTRNRDQAENTSATDLIGQTEGTLYFEGTSDVVGGSTNLINFNHAANSITINRQSTKSIRGTISGPNIIFTSSPIDGTFKAAIAYKDGDSAFYVNGVQVGTSSTSFSFGTALSQIYLGSGINYFALTNQSAAKQALVFKTRLSNEELADLTTL